MLAQHLIQDYRFGHNIQFFLNCKNQVQNKKIRPFWIIVSSNLIARTMCEGA
jgi:hypothetical protein